MPNKYSKTKAVASIDLKIFKDSVQHWSAKGKLEQIDAAGETRIFRGVLTIAKRQCAVELYIIPTRQTDMLEKPDETF